MSEALRYIQLQLDDIEVVSNIRQEFDEEKMAELTASVKENGILQPLVVVKTDGGKSRLIVGERRLRAARAAGLKAVPVTVVDEMTEEEVLEAQIAENLQRDDISAIEEAEAYKKLIETCGLNQAQVAAKVGVDPSQVSNRLRLLRLPKATQNKILRRQMSAGHGIALLRVLPKGDAPLPAMYEDIEKAISEREMSVQQAEDTVDSLIWQRCKSLRKASDTNWKNSYEALFDTKKVCKDCPYIAAVRKSYGNAGNKETEERCLRPECWQQHQDKAWAEIDKKRKAKEAESNREVARPEDRPAVPTVEAAPPLDGLDPREAERLGRAAWSIAGPIDAYRRDDERIECRRECYLTLEALFKHFADRAKVDDKGKEMDFDFHNFTAAIPEVGISFSIDDYGPDDPRFQVTDDGDFLLKIGEDSAENWLTFKGGMVQGGVYYCLTVLHKHGTTIRQRFAIPLKDLTLVIAADDSRGLDREQRSAWYDLVQALPAAPVSCALDQEPAAEEDENEDKDGEGEPLDQDPTEVGDNPEEDEDDE